MHSSPTSISSPQFSLVAHSSPRFTAVLLAVLITSCLTTVHAVKPAPDGNTAYGNGALFSNTVGTNNSAFGFEALFSNTSGQANTAVGAQSLFNNTTASGNTASGFLALFSNTTGAANTATGSQALNFNTVGNENTATGDDALFNNTTGNDNTASGTNAGHSNTTGAFNTVNGATALYFNTTGSFNTADGSFALNLSTGSNNIALGYAAGVNLTTGDFNIDIGNQGVTGESSTIRIGTDGNHVATFIAGIATTPVVGTAVVIDANGQLGVGVSSERFKHDVRPMDLASEALLQLRPVTFRYKNEIDPNRSRQFGLIAEEVAKIDPGLVVRDRDGKILTVRYDAVNAMLLNEFLKEHQKVEQQQRTIAELSSNVSAQKQALASTIAAQQQQIEKLEKLVQKQSAQIQRVEAKVELRGTTTQVATNGE